MRHIFFDIGYRMHDRITIKRMDAVELLNGLSEESLDLVITDPPYESMEKHRSVGSTTRLKSKWFPIFRDNRMDELFDAFYHAMKKNSHLYIFTNWNTALTIQPIAESAGFKCWTPIVWDKVSMGLGYHYRSRYELIMFFEKGKRKLNSMSKPNILAYKRIHRGFPTQKPVDLLRILVEQSSSFDDLVCDPFLGSGSTAVACLKTNRHFVGCDIWDEAIKVSTMRLNSMIGPWGDQSKNGKNGE